MIKKNLILLLIILIFGLTLLCFKYSSTHEEFVLKNINYRVKSLDNPFSSLFNIDLQCKNKQENKYLGWKCWWNKNQTKNLVKPDDSFKGTEFSNYLRNTPLKYDGIFRL